LRPRFSCFLRLASRRSGTEVLSGQLLVGQALVHDGAHYMGEAKPVVLFPIVEAEGLLVQIAEHVERVNADVGAFDGALQEAPEAFESVGVDQAIDIPLSVVNDAMMEVLGQSTVAAPLVGVERGTMLDVLMDVAVQGLGVDVLDDVGDDGGSVVVVGALHDAQHGDFGTHASLLDNSLALGLVHVLAEPTDESLVGFDVAAHLLEAFGLHGKPDTAKHEPRGFLGNAQTTRHFIGADAVLGIGQHPDSGKPLVQTERGVLENRSHLHRELLAASAAFPDAPSLEEHRVGRVTVSALDTIRPAQELKELERDIGISEVRHRFAESLRSTNLGHDVTYNRGMGVSSILLP
jgi:hypothetical protein